MHVKTLRDRADDTVLKEFSARSRIRALDILLSLTGLLLTLPLIFLLATAIKIDSRGPVFFMQTRLGLYKREFTLIKFRTMMVNAEHAGPVWAQRNDARVTRVGRILRRSRLDEIPQFYNILRGDMSLVGPRPIRAQFASILATMDGRYDQRFLVKPGLTGFAQIYAPYGSTAEEQLEKLPYDLKYLNGLSITEYFKVIFLTLKTVILSKGV